MASRSERDDDATIARVADTATGREVGRAQFGSGRRIRYMLRHWEKLTFFLRQVGAPLDNNVCERALKKAILHRKNSLFYKTQNGARVGDLFMT